MGSQNRLNAMRAAVVAFDAAQAQPTVVAALEKCGLTEQFRYAGELLREEVHAEVQRLMAVTDAMPR